MYPIHGLLQKTKPKFLLSSLELTTLKTFSTIKTRKLSSFLSEYRFHCGFRVLVEVYIKWVTHSVLYFSVSISTKSPQTVLKRHRWIDFRKKETRVHDSTDTSVQTPIGGSQSPFSCVRKDLWDSPRLFTDSSVCVPDRTSVS